MACLREVALETEQAIHAVYRHHSAAVPDSIAAMLSSLQRLHEQVVAEVLGGEEAGGAAEAGRVRAKLRCASLACANLAGASEAALPRKRCSACRVAWYCSADCARAAWAAGHKAACRQLAAQRAAENGDESGAGGGGGGA